MFKIKNLHLDANLSELTHRSEDLVRITSLHRKSNVKVRLRYIKSSKRKARKQLFQF